MDAPLAAGQIMALPRLRERALDGVGDQFLVPLAPGPALIDLRDTLALSS